MEAPLGLTRKETPMVRTLRRVILALASLAALAMAVGAGWKPWYD
jgi:hypothetical protein